MMERAEELAGPSCVVCSVFRLPCLANHITSVSSLWLETNCKQDVKVEWVELFFKRDKKIKPS